MLSTAGGEIGQFIRRAETAQALRRSEADHRAIFERSPIGIVTDQQRGRAARGQPCPAHDARARLPDDALDAVAGPAPGVRPGRGPRALRAACWRGSANGKSVQVRAGTGGGKWLWLQLTATSIPDSSGRPEHVLVMVEDVTTVREAQDKLGEALEVAAQRKRHAREARPHQDRVPVDRQPRVPHRADRHPGVQRAHPRRRPRADEVRAYGGYIFNDADRVNRLIGDMLDLDRMESGRMSIRTARRRHQRGPQRRHRARRRPSPTRRVQVRPRPPPADRHRATATG